MRHSRSPPPVPSSSPPSPPRWHISEARQKSSAVARSKWITSHDVRHETSRWLLSCTSLMLPYHMIMQQQSWEHVMWALNCKKIQNQWQWILTLDLIQCKKQSSLIRDTKQRIKVFNSPCLCLLVMYIPWRDRTDYYGTINLVFCSNPQKYHFQKSWREIFFINQALRVWRLFSFRGPSVLHTISWHLVGMHRASLASPLPLCCLLILATLLWHIPQEEIRAGPAARLHSLGNWGSYRQPRAKQNRVLLAVQPLCTTPPPSHFIGIYVACMGETFKIRIN